MKATKFALAAFALIALVAPSAARADTTAGVFSISGDLTLTSTSMAWGGTATIASGPTGIYSALGDTSIGIVDLSTATEPVGSTFTGTSFISFTGDPSLSSLLINYIDAGIDSDAECSATPAVGQICTPSSPAGYLQAMNFENTALGSGIGSGMGWDLSGVSADGTETWDAAFTTQFGVPYQTILAAIASTGSVFTSYSATITVTENPTTAPEPSTIALLGAGLLGLVAANRRKRLA